MTIKSTSLQFLVVLPNSHAADKTSCDPACSKTDSDEDDSADVRNLLCPELSEELVGLTQHVLHTGTLHTAQKIVIRYNYRYITEIYEILLDSHYNY